MRRPWARWPAVVSEPAGQAGASPPERKQRWLLRELPVLILVALLIAMGVKALVAQAFFIPSASMVPTLLKGDRVLVSRLSYRLHEPRRGDVVVFASPIGGDSEKDDRSAPTRALHFVFESVGLRQPSTEDFIKRVVALPGETVESRAGRIYVDGRPLGEPYLAQAPVGDFAPKKVPAGRLWVMGDNRNGSHDSRVFGPIDDATVVGRAVLRIWPPLRLGFL